MPSYTITVPHRVAKQEATRLLLEALTYYKARYPSANIDWRQRGPLLVTFEIAGTCANADVEVRTDCVQANIHLSKVTFVPESLIRAIVQTHAEKWLDGSMP